MARATGASAEMPASDCGPAVDRPRARMRLSRTRGGGFIARCPDQSRRSYAEGWRSSTDSRRNLLAAPMTPGQPIVFAQSPQIDPPADAAGDSAGAGTVLAIRDEGPLPAAVVTFSPWTDLAATGASLDETSRNARRRGRSRAQNLRRRRPRTASALRRFSGVPPMPCTRVTTKCCV
jgi:hypothetical protein